MNIGIIGPGGIADDQHAPAIKAQPGARLWSVLSRDAGRGAAFAERHGLAAEQPAHTDLRAMLADPELDAVLIATPDRLHRAQAEAAARAGKHILLEKPMATSLQEARAIGDACTGAGVTLAMAYHMRWHPGHRALHGMVQDGGLGTLRHMRIQWTFLAANGGNWRAHEETGRWWSLAANGTHCIDQIRWFMRPTCGDITDVRSLYSHAKFESDHDETTVALFRFESGATAELTVSVQFASPSRVELYGDAGWARCEDTMGRHGSGHIETHAGPVGYTPVRPFIGLWNDFVGAIAENRTPEVSSKEAIANVGIMERIAEASGTDHYLRNP